MESNKSSLPIQNLEQLNFLLSDTWGPSVQDKNENYEGIPFHPNPKSKLILAPFNFDLSKAQMKLTNPQNHNFQNNQQTQQQLRERQQLLKKEQQQKLNITEDGFNEVQVKIAPKNQQKGPQNNKFNKFQKQPKLYEEEKIKSQVKVKKVKKSKLKNRNAGYQRTRYIQFKEGILVKSHYEELFEIDKHTYDTCKVGDIEIQELARTGKVRQFKPSYNSITVKKPLDMPPRTYQKDSKLINSNAFDDELIFKIIEQTLEKEEQLKNEYEELQDKLAKRKEQRQEKRKAMNAGENVNEDSDDEKIKDEEPPTEYQNVYITDQLLTGLMTLKNSEFPWDIKVTKDGHTYVFDKFNKDNVSYLDYETMHQNSTMKNLLPTDETEVQNICRENTSVKQTFIKNATAQTPVWEYTMPDNEEYGEYNQNQVKGNEQDDIGFRYIKATIDDQIQVFVRSKIDAYEVSGNGEKVPIICKAFTEWDPIKFNWRNRMQLSLGSLISELQIYNLCELNKALMQMYLSGAQRIKFAYVSRDLRDISKSDKHQILNVTSYSFEELQNELKVDPQDFWKIIKFLVNYLKKVDDGEYLLLKHSYKSSLMLYHLPEGGAECEEGEEGEEDEEEEEYQEEENQEDEE